MTSGGWDSIALPVVSITGIPEYAQIGWPLLYLLNRMKLFGPDQSLKRFKHLIILLINTHKMVGVMRGQVIGDGQGPHSMIASNSFTVPPMVRLASMIIH